MRREEANEVSVKKQSELSPKRQSDRRRVPEVVEEVSGLVFRETATVAISSLVSVLSGVLLVTGADPIEEARNVGEAIQGIVREHLKAVPRGAWFVTD
jgi:hypothetical protein